MRLCLCIFVFACKTLKPTSSFSIDFQTTIVGPILPKIEQLLDNYSREDLSFIAQITHLHFCQGVLSSTLNNAQANLV